MIRIRKLVIVKMVFFILRVIYFICVILEIKFKIIFLYNNMKVCREIIICMNYVSFFYSIKDFLFYSY